MRNVALVFLAAVLWLAAVSLTQSDFMRLAFVVVAPLESSEREVRLHLHGFRVRELPTTVVGVVVV